MNSTMEHIHGIDVSWMTHGAPKGLFLFVADLHARTGPLPLRYAVGL